MKSRAQRYRYVRHVVSGTRPSPWSPLSLGSSLAAWYKADAGCYTDAACLFASASSQYLSRTGSAILRGAASGWWLSCWVYMNSAAANFDIHGCVTAFTSGRLLRVMSTGRVDLVACNAGAFARVTHTTNIGTGAWHFVYAQYDGANIGVSIDGGALQTAALASYVPGSNAFAVGNDTAINDFFDGRIARFFGGDGTLSAGQITSLYNAGAGLFYADLGATLQAACGFAYNLCEASGDRVDSVGALNLTPTNGPTVAAGPGEGACVDNSPIKRWEDQSGNARHLTQSTIASQPLYRTGAQNGLPVVRCDGSDDYLATSGSVAHAMVFAVSKNNSGFGVVVGVAGSNRYFFASFSDGNLYTSDGTVAISAAATINAYKQMTGRMDASGSLRLDGSEIATGTQTTRTGATGIGCRNFDATPQVFLSGDVCEVFILSSVVNDGSRGSAEAHLRARWATP